MKIKTEIEVDNVEFCDNCPMFDLFKHRNCEAFCRLFNTFLSYSPRYLGYVRCDECKQAEVKDEN